MKSNRPFYFALNCLIALTITAFAQESKVDPDKTEDITFELATPIKFADGSEKKSFTKAEIEALRDLPVDMGGNKTDGATLKNKQDKRRVRTCREYDDALLAGYRPSSNADIMIAAWFKYPCGTLQLLQRATRHKRSFLPQELFDLKLMPLKLFPVITDYEQVYGRDIENETYHDQAEKGELEVIEKFPHRFVCKFKGSKYYLTEVVRADFNGDGTEDILFREAEAAIGATYRTYNLLILTRKSSRAKYERIFQSGFVMLPKHYDLFILKAKENLLYSKIIWLGLKVERDEIASTTRDQELNRLLNEVKVWRARVPITDKLRESNVIGWLKSHMSDPPSFRLHDMSYTTDRKPYCDYGYSIANVAYYDGTVKQKAILRVPPHGFVVSFYNESLWR